jgi:hypothetical protein
LAGVRADSSGIRSEDPGDTFPFWVSGGWMGLNADATIKRPTIEVIHLEIIGPFQDLGELADAIVDGVIANVAKW